MPVPSTFAARLAASLLVLLSGGGAIAAVADTVLLRNGDRLTGKILHLSADALTLETNWGGKIRIDRAEISSFGAGRPLAWLPYWGSSPKRATFAATDSAGVVTIDEGDGPRQLPMSRVAVLEPRPEETENGVATRGRVTLSTAWSQGNSDSERVWGEADFAARTRDWRYDIGLKVRRERDDGATTADRWLVSGDYDRFLDETQFSYLRGSLEHDRFKDLSLRGAVGGGAGVQLVDDERTQFSLRGGLDLVSEDRIATVSESYPAVGWGVTFKRRLELMRADLFHDQQGFWNVEDSERMTVRSRTGIRAPVSGSLSASLQLNLDWEREPPAGKRATDSSWLLGLGYEW